MDPKQIRERLGLPEDASDEQVKEAVQELNAATGVTPGTPGDGSTVVPGTNVTPSGTGQPTPDAEVTPDGATAEDDPNNVATAALKLPKGMVAIDEATLETLKVGASAGIEIKTKSEKDEREALVKAAIQDGRIAPAGREHWLNSLEKDPTAKATLASLTPGLVPVAMRELGRGGNGAEGEAAAAGGDLELETVNNWTDSLFPEVRNLRQRDKALAAGESPGRQRVTADASYRR